jgi:micrococcal nuclease
MKTLSTLLLILALACAAIVHARDSKFCKPQSIAPVSLGVPIVGVSDGDTLTARFPADFVYPNQQSIRLLEIDAPESRQAFGNRSKQALSELAFGKTLRVTVTGNDAFCRPLVLVEGDQGSVNLQMVKSGYAWFNREYGRDRAYQTAEDEARAARRGLWVDPNPQYPGDFRRAQKAGLQRR